MTYAIKPLPFLLAITMMTSAVFGQSSSSPWNLESLSQTPEMKWIDKTSPIRSLTYRGEEFNGRSTEVFAFYATPGTIAGDPALDKHLPAVVLVHGGGGTAFADWVWLWAKRGYAAIAMDLSGRQPEAPKFAHGKLVPNLRVNRERLELGGPEHGHPQKFDSAGGELDDDWPFHAVASVVRAHSLIRSFPEVDAERTAVTGISWGGYTTCLVASVDSRFKAAVPVYGCGFLFDGESVQKPAIDRLEPEQRATWIKLYDPSSHLAKCRVPILFVNGTNDKHYPLDSYSRSFGLVTSPKQLRIEVKMRHSHVAGWEPKEIGLFIDHHLLDKKPLPQLGSPEIKAHRIVVPYEASVALKSATLHYTNDDGPLVARQWKSHAAQVTKTEIIIDNAPLADATIWMIDAVDQRDAMVSTEVFFVRQ
jgi:dienelactone hydrolase